MPSRARPAAAVAVAVLLQALRAQSSKECALEPMPQAAGSGLLQGVQRTNASTELALDFASGSSYCYQKDSARFGDCWAKKPPSNTSNCTVDSGKAACLCADFPCHVDNLHQSVPTTGRCASKSIYVVDGEKHVNQSKEIDVTGTGEEAYCTDMVKNDQWQAKHIVKLSSDPPAISGNGWWTCWSPNTWHDGKCQRRTRYLGESCWDGKWGAGVCAGSDSSYDEYSTSCYKGTCVPYAWVKEREECTCAWIGWNFLWTCSASGGKCGGHPCSLSTRDGKKYCDYAQSQNW